MPSSESAVVILLLLSVGCREPPASPSQQMVDGAWQRSQEAARRWAEAELQVRHVRRLRDLDRLRLQSDSAAVQTVLAWLRGLVAGLGLLLAATAVWLAVEIRRPRTYSALGHWAVDSKGGVPRRNEESTESRPGSA